MAAVRRYRAIDRGHRVSIRLVRTRKDLESVRALFREYGGWLAQHREITTFDDSILATGLAKMDEEIRQLPGDYSLPRGALLLVSRGRRLIGCGALRPLGPEVGELKRVDIRSSYRGQGLGRRLTLALVERARRLGYRRLLLDTLPGMTSAINLYRSLGFEPVPRYWDHPFPAALFFGLELRRNGTVAGRARVGARPGRSGVPADRRHLARPS